MTKKSWMGYPSDLSNEQWELVKNFFAKKDPRGRKPKHDKRSIVNAILYVVKGGIQWKMMPKDFPHYKTVHEYFMIWCRSGLWDELLTFVNKKARAKQGREPEPTYGIIDSQSVKNLYSNEEQGFDGNKKNKGT